MLSDFAWEGPACSRRSSCSAAHDSQGTSHGPCIAMQDYTPQATPDQELVDEIRVS
jgi:hypothetical protein